jgi:F0F1-type ATP synthase assembly protein I
MAMIKSLFGEEDEEQRKEESKPEIIDERKEILEISGENAEVLRDIKKNEIDTQNNVVSQEDVKTEEQIETIDEIRTAIETGNTPPGNTESVRPFKINRPIGQPQSERKVEEKPKSSSTKAELYTKSERELELERKLAEIEAELHVEKIFQDKINKAENFQKREEENRINEQNQNQKELENSVKQSADLPFNKNIEHKNTEIKTDNPGRINISQKNFKPESKTETFRKSGLAWSAAIALFGSIVFMMILGWFADQLLGSFPWGITIGITLGAIIGFIQFFRMTSQIINPKPNDFEKVSLSSNLEKTSSNVEIPKNDLSQKR